MVRIIQNHEGCIGCGTCAALCPKFWEMRDDAKAHLLGGKYDEVKKEYELEIEKIGCNKEAEESCPVQVIKVADYFGVPKSGIKIVSGLKSKNKIVEV